MTLVNNETSDPKKKATDFTKSKLSSSTGDWNHKRFETTKGNHTSEITQGCTFEGRRVDYSS
jgi:hypothetical protein